MKITRIRICKTGLPYVGGAYVWGAGNAIEVAHASVVVIDTDAGLQGCGEFTPCGENYMAAHSEGAPMYRVAPQKVALRCSLLGHPGPSLQSTCLDAAWRQIDRRRADVPGRTPKGRG